MDPRDFGQIDRGNDIVALIGDAKAVDDGAGGLDLRADAERAQHRHGVDREPDAGADGLVGRHSFPDLDRDARALERER